MSLTLDTAKTLGYAGMSEELDKLYADARAELDRACVKFPMFPDRVTDLEPDSVRTMLSVMRQKNDAGGGRSATAQTVRREEELEAIEAIQQGDAASARKEIVQEMAMLLRMYAHLPDYLHGRRS